MTTQHLNKADPVPGLSRPAASEDPLPTLARKASLNSVAAVLDYGVRVIVSLLVKPLLVASGIMTEENRSIPGVYPEEVAAAMWNYVFVIEDQSKGVHNPAFAKALLTQALDALK